MSRYRLDGVLSDEGIRGLVWTLTQFNTLTDRICCPLNGIAMSKSTSLQVSIRIIRCFLSRRQKGSLIRMHRTRRSIVSRSLRPSRHEQSPLPSIHPHNHIPHPINRKPLPRPSIAKDRLDLLLREPMVRHRLRRLLRPALLTLTM